MAEKRILMKHHKDDYECMWNGIEDLYMDRTGEVLPAFFFFALAGAGNFIYMNTPKGEIKKRACWNDGRTGKMYERLAPLIGMTYRRTEGTGFSHMLKQAKGEIMEGCPVILGCLDMYELEYYPKFFHKEHIPIHYVMMTGFSDERQCVYVQDCGIEEAQEISYEALERALDIRKSQLSDKNGMYRIRLEDKLPSVEQIAKRALRSKAEAMLNPPTRFLGIKGMRKLAKEFGLWEQQLEEKDYRAVLTDIAVFAGTVPCLPDALVPQGEGSGVLRMAGREKPVHVLRELSERYGNLGWKQAAEEFEKSGALMADMVDKICGYLLGERNHLEEIPVDIMNMADVEERAFRFMLDGSSIEEQ